MFPPAGEAWRCHVFQSVLQAIAEADCGPRTLVIRNQLYEYENEDEQEIKDEGIPIWTFNDLDLLIPYNKMAMLTKNLRILILEDLWTENRDAEVDNPAYRYLTHSGSIGRFVESAPQLEVLTIRFFKLEYPASGGIRTECLTGAAQLPGLKTLSIGGLSIEATELVNWLLKFSESLQHVRLFDMDLTKGHWIGLLDSLRRGNLGRLRCVRFRGLTVGGGHATWLSRTEEEMDWGWDRNQKELWDYVQYKTDQNPWLAHHREWFIEDDKELHKRLSRYC